MHWLTLTVAVVSNVVANLALKAAMRNADSETAWLAIKSVSSQPTLWLGLASAVVLLGSYLLTIRALNVGIAYAIVTGAALALMTLLSATVFDDRLTLKQIVGVTLVIGGMVLIMLPPRAS